MARVLPVHRKIDPDRLAFSSSARHNDPDVRVV